ncbi:MAG: oligopeptide/dipeptide ABC transporter ATP-binding protein [Crocinitomicaceae bacterium]|jgi:oligopeptide/dipeptide ABC transporter ATP-binding protein
MDNGYALEIKNLVKYFPVKSSKLFAKPLTLKAVDGVCLNIKAGETLGIVGESGCGKSTLAKTIARLLPSTSGDIFFKNTNITRYKHKELKAIRSSIQYVFQDPYESLNPRHTVLTILEEPFIIHTHLNSQERKAQVESLLVKVGLPIDCVQKYPHEFSGGQRQRIGIARAIALKPDILICDEPVSALDVSVQSQIINLLKDLQTELGLSIIFIAHDLAVVKHISDRIAVMYLGEFVEQASSDEIFKHPNHPYTQLLMNAIPNPDPSKRPVRLKMTGELPSPINPPEGCRFQSRCDLVDDKCITHNPALIARTGNDLHLTSCHKAEQSSELWVSPWQL